MENETTKTQFSKVLSQSVKKIYTVTMPSNMRYTAYDLYGRDKVHDIVWTLCNQILDLKGLNSNSATDIASLVPADFQNYVASLETCYDEELENFKVVFKRFSNSFYDHLNFQHDNKL